MRCEEIEVYLSGYVDDELPLQHRQMVEAHIEGCVRCGGILEELREVTANTSRISYEEPSEKDWKKVEKHVLQTYSRQIGWLILIVWTILTSGYGLFQYAVNPQEPLIQKIIVFSLFLGLGLLFLSVLTERLRDRRSDRYRGVQQ